VRGDQLSRQWRILRRIEAAKNGSTVAELAALTGVSHRTAYRDLDDLQRAGFPIYTEKVGEDKRWRMVDGYRFSPGQPLRATELMALRMSEALLGGLRGTVFHESLAGLMQKVEAGLPDQTREYLARVRDSFCAGFGPCHDYGRCAGIVSQVASAVVEGRTLEIVYQGLRDAERLRRRIDPYKVWFQDGTIYVVARCHLRNAIRTFVVDRISLLQPTDEHFTVPDTFRFEDYAKHSFKVMTDEIFPVRIRISPSWARYVGERVWHASQHIQKLIDGGIEVSFRVAGLDEIKQWVLSLGPQAYVVEPVELREAVRRDMVEALGQYGSEQEDKIREAGAKGDRGETSGNRPLWQEGSRG
jgi:predicted DNA-binding transcriptional regulator YafY